ncbi:MAG: hypothetical protein BWY70_00291 [Bacteroidetes bacterium ADurb.Bin408]|nr:MAG: hypothetical protein BWY70_00291 [Bacteroidetes bacterium ADurb.Bin408]
MVMLHAQTTVISHGYANLLSDPVNGWMLDMANGIVARAGGGTIRVYNKTTGNFDYKSGSGMRTVLLFDWWDDSNDLHKGFSEGAGAALFAALMNGYNMGLFNLNQLHFIGHSRGCTVNGECAERLLVLGIPVEQLTYIDAHDSGGLGITITDYDANPDSIHSGVEGWNGVGWADSYWQNALFSLNGRPVDGTYSSYKGTISHDGIREWYLETITDTSIHDGYYYSINGGGSAFRPPRTGPQRNPFFTFENEGIMNGDFERGGVLYNKLPGWWYHGGGGNADINNTYLVLRSGDDSKRHDRLYIPPYANYIKFDYKIDTEDDTGNPPYIDKMYVLINDTIVTPPLWMDYTMPTWSQMMIDVTARKNTTITLGLSLVDENGGTDDLDAEVWIDNIVFQMSPVPVAPISENISPCKLYPSVTQNTIYLDKSCDETLDIEIFDIRGKSVIHEFIHEQHKEINLSHIKPGLYVYRIYSGKKSIKNGKLIKI